MAIIPPITPVALPQEAAPVTGATGAVGGASGTPAPGFTDALGEGIQQVSDLENQADAMIQDLATGGPTKIHEVMIANTQSSLAVDMLVQVRDRGLQAYQEIMRMQL
ncbi:MAG: flagellar hook-basal body complex protein FliE [Nitriliruptoraceae bacterium]